MPTQIEWCVRCSAAIYDEDCVPGGCGCPDGQLRGLLAMRRIAAQPAPTPQPFPVMMQAPVRPAPPSVAPHWPAFQAALQAPVSQPFVAQQSPAALPELTPDMLMSGAALAEYRAMQAGVIPTTSRSAARGRNADEPVEVSWDEGEAPPVTGALEGLWLGQAEMEQFASSGMDIEFSTGDVEFEAPRPRFNEAARFRVDRPPPAARTPSGPRVGEVIRQDGETVGGRQALRQAAAMPRSIREVRAQAREGTVSRQEAVVREVRPASLPARTHASRPEPAPLSAYERIIGGHGPLDD